MPNKKHEKKGGNLGKRVISGGKILHIYNTQSNFNRRSISSQIQNEIRLSLFWSGSNLHVFAIITIFPLREDCGDLYLFLFYRKSSF